MSSNNRPCKVLKALDVATLAYIAGLIDGEGCLYGMARKRHHTKNVTGLRVDFEKGVAVQMADQAVIQWLAEVTALGKARRVARHKRRPHTKVMWGWRLQGSREIIQFLRAIRPYLRVKSEQAGMVIELCELQALSTTQVRYQEQRQAQLVAMLREAKV